MPSLLRYSSHLAPTNSLSARRHSILSDPNNLMKRSIKSFRSLVDEFPNFGIIWKRIGKATPLYTMPRVRILMFFDPNFQLVLSKASLYGGLWGSRENTNRAIMSESSEYSDINLCILRSDESTLTLVSKPQASFSKQTVCTLHNALINKPKNFIRAKFILSPKNSFNVSDKIVTLFSALVFIVSFRIGGTILTNRISRFYPNKRTYCY